MMPSNHLYSRYGVELEYMIVDLESLDVRPMADQLISAVAGTPQECVARGWLEWANELALHLIELRTAEPAGELEGLDQRFQSEVKAINKLLAPLGACLLPTAMHPWMDPANEFHLWPHGQGEIYRAYDRIFDCRGHGWSNLQATHLNLPFEDDQEFVQLHAAIRLLLPLLPGLAASSPFMQGRKAGYLDMRLEAYRHNCSRIPSLTGGVIPEPVTSIQNYRQRILERIYRDLAPHDPDQILQEEWSNARGAIARFERNTIEIRLLDIQECPRADLALLHWVVAVLKELTSRGPSASSEADLQGELEKTLIAVAREAGSAVIENQDYLRALGFSARSSLTVQEVCLGLTERSLTMAGPYQEVVQLFFREGCLSRRILRATGDSPSRQQLREVYQRLAKCLMDGILFQTT